MKRAYVTGGTGAIGMALIRKLLTEKTTVVVFVRKESKRIQNLLEMQKELKTSHLLIVPAGLEDIYLSVQKEKGQQLKFSLPSEESQDKEGNIVFYHLGWAGTFGEARNDFEKQQKNVSYTKSAVKLAKELCCNVFIGAGSQAEYGRAEGRLTPYLDTHPESEYGKAKLAAGIESRILCEAEHIRHSWVRILSVYGPYDGKDTMIMSTITKLLQGTAAPLTQGEQTWDYLYADDAANALYLLGERKNLPSKTYCLGSGVERPLKDYILELQKAAGTEEKLLAFGAVPYGEKQVMHLCADIRELTADTGFVPEYTFEKGIKKTVDFVKKHCC